MNASEKYRRFLCTAADAACPAALLLSLPAAIAVYPPFAVLRLPQIGEGMTTTAAVFCAVLCLCRLLAAPLGGKLRRGECVELVLSALLFAAALLFRGFGGFAVKGYIYAFAASLTAPYALDRRFPARARKRANEEGIPSDPFPSPQADTSRCDGAPIGSAPDGNPSAARRGAPARLLFCLFSLGFLLTAGTAAAAAFVSSFAFSFLLRLMALPMLLLAACLCCCGERCRLTGTLTRIAARLFSLLPVFLILASAVDYPFAAPLRFALPVGLLLFLVFSALNAAAIRKPSAFPRFFSR